MKCTCNLPNDTVNTNTNKTFCLLVRIRKQKIYRKVGISIYFIGNTDRLLGDHKVFWDGNLVDVLGAYVFNC